MKVNDWLKIQKIYHITSFLVLFLCLAIISLWISSSFISNERKRAEIFSQQIQVAFDLQMRSLVEEFWTGNIESVAKRIEHVAASLRLPLQSWWMIDANEQCAQTNKGWQTKECQKYLKAHRAKVTPGVSFQQKEKRLIYLAKLMFGKQNLGTLIVTMHDPYNFIKQVDSKLTLWFFWLPLIFVAMIWVAWLNLSQKYIWRPYSKFVSGVERREALSKMAAQLAHDIRSPISALNMLVQSGSQLPTAQRQLIQAVAGRMTLIADNLLAEYRHSDNDKKGACFVGDVLEFIVAEKKVILERQAGPILKASIDSCLYTQTIDLPSEELGRLISNIIKNAMEATDSKSSGEIEILARPILQNGKSGFQVQVRDNGQGMPTEVLSKILSEGGSYGKEKGNGLGLHHARNVLKKLGGDLDIQSDVTVGTTVSLFLPSGETNYGIALPKDFSDKEIIVLEDDPGIAEVWKAVLQTQNYVILTDPEEFDLRHYPIDRCRYFFDYEIKNSAMTGLDLIVTNKLGQHAVLVTNYANDWTVQNRALQAGSHVLPKSAVPRIRDIIAF